MIKERDVDLFFDDDIFFVNEDCINVTFLSDEMGILSVDLNDINLVDVNFDKDDLETITHIRLLVWHNRFKRRKIFKKYIAKELMHVAWHPTRWWDWCMSEHEKKEILVVER